MPRCSDCNQRVREHGDRCTVCTRHRTAEIEARNQRTRLMEDWQTAQTLINRIEGAWQCGEELDNSDIKDALFLLLKHFTAQAREQSRPRY